MSRKPKDINKDKNKSYNVTDLDVGSVFERRVFHRDYFAHYFRWSHALRTMMDLDDGKRRLCDFGCGDAPLAEVGWRNRIMPSSYVGLDIRQTAVDKAAEILKTCSFPVELTKMDLVDDSESSVAFFESIRASLVCSFEVLEHVGKKNIQKFLQNMRRCGTSDCVYLLSTPNYDPRVGAAQNHIYGGIVNEWSHDELGAEIEKYFVIEAKYGTFASQKDYVHLLGDHEKQLFDKLQRYYDVNMLACIFAPLFPRESRNCLWRLRRKNDFIDPAKPITCISLIHQGDLFS